MHRFSTGAAGLTLALALLILTGGQPAGAQNRPWCTERGIGSWGFPDCSYQSQAQCLATASGTRLHCTANPWYQPPGTHPRMRHARRRRR